MNKFSYDIVIIGAGVAGYSAALRAVKLGKKTALIEKNQVGGTCLNQGCIPTKKLISESRIYQRAIRLHECGVFEQRPVINNIRISEEIKKVTGSLRTGLLYSLKQAGVEIYQGAAKIVNEQQVDVETDDGTEHLETLSIIIATGSKPKIPNIPGLSDVKYETTDSIFNENNFEFETLTIIGGGIIGVEFADALSMLGKKICIAEKEKRILGNMPVEVSAYAEKMLKRKNVDIICGAEVKDVFEEDDEIIVRVKSLEKDKVIFSDALLVTAGRNADNEIIENSDIFIETDGKSIAIDSNYKTNVDGIYAIGDVSSNVQLAYIAAKQGEDVIEYIINGTPCRAIDNYPDCVFMTPEIVSVGMSEETLSVSKIKYISGKTLMSANGKAVLESEPDGFIKILMDFKTHEIIGGQMMCEGAVELSGLLVQYISAKVTGEEIVNMVFPHPSIAEDIKKAVLNGLYNEA